MEAGADFVKTSTGFSTSGATVEDVRLMKQTVGDVCQVKAAGGVRCFDDLKAMIEAGADRIGTSSGVALLAGSHGLLTAVLAFRKPGEIKNRHCRLTKGELKTSSFLDWDFQD